MPFFYFKCREAEDDEDDKYIPMENLRYVEPGIKQPNVINLCPLDKYAYAPESKLWKSLVTRQNDKEMGLQAWTVIG